MKQLTCEMCGSTDILKQNGVFVCQTCGCKYSVEEAKKMMIEGVVEVKGSVKVDDSDKEAIYKDIAINAYNAGNTKEAYQYFLKVLEINPADYHSLFYKGMCQGWEMAPEKDRVREAVAAYHLAVKYIPVENAIQEIKEIFIGDLSNLMSVWLKNANEWYSNHFRFGPIDSNGKKINEEQRYNKINTGKMVVEYIDSYIHDILSSCSSSLIESVGEVYCTACEYACDFFCQEVPYLDADDDYEFRVAFKSEGLSSNDKAKYITAYENMIFEVRKYNPDFKRADLLNGRINIWNPVQATNYYEQKKINDNRPSPNVKLCHKTNEKIDQRLSEYKKTILQQKKKAAREKYWSEHSDEKQQYESRLNSIESEINSLQERDSLLAAKIQEIQKDLIKRLPIENQLDTLKEKLNILVIEKSDLGLLSWNKKKKLQLEIDYLQKQINDTDIAVKNQKKTIQDDVTTRVASIEVDRKPYLDKISSLENEKHNIMLELTKDR